MGGYIGSLYGTNGWRLPQVKPVNGSNFDYDSVSFNGGTDIGANKTSTQDEFAHLYNVTLGNRASFDVNGQYQRPDLINTGPFKNVQSHVYWTGERYLDDRVPYGNVHAWVFDFSNGSTGDRLAYVTNSSLVYSAFFAWVVHPGDVGVAVAVPEPEAYTLGLAGLAALLVLRRGRS